MTARRVDQRVLSAGTTAQFCLLLVLLIGASTAVIPDVFNTDYDPHGNTLGCTLAAGLNPDSDLNSMIAQLLASKNALAVCLGHYVPSASLWVQVLGAGLVAGAAGAFFWGIPAWKGRRSQVTELRDADVSGDLVPALEELVQAAELGPAPRFVMNAGRVTTTSAVVFGRRTVCLDGGLVAIRTADPSRFRAVVLHELAHIRNGDATITCATVALWRAFLLVLLVPEAVLTGWDWIAEAHALWGTAVRTVDMQNLVLFACLTVLVYLTKADILRNREMYADMDALSWEAGLDTRAWDAGPGRVPDTPTTARRLFASLARLWDAHPRPDIRRQSLTDPVALFGIQPLPVFLAGAATALLGGQLETAVGWLGAQDPLAGALSSGAGRLDWLSSWLPAVPITLIVGVALWRAVTHAVLTGTRPPSGVRTGLWLGAGLVVGEWLLGDFTGAQWWLPGQPEFLVVPILVAVVITCWTAQCAQLFIRCWRGRTLRPAMLLGLAVPWLAFSVWFGWWQQEGSSFAAGPSLFFTYQRQILQHQFPVPVTGHSGALSVIAPVMITLPTVPTYPLVIWVATAMWLVPLLAWTLGPPAKVPGWVRHAMPDATDPPLSFRPLPSLRNPLRAALLGGALGAVAVVVVMAYQHTWQPPADQRAGLYILAYSYLLTAALTVAPASAAAVTALLVNEYRMLVALAAAGVAALAAFTVAFLLAATDGCLGPLNTMASACVFRPKASWGLLAQPGQAIMPTVLGLGMFVAAAVVLLVEAWRRLAPRIRSGNGTLQQDQSPRWTVRRAGIAMIWLATVGLALTATLPTGQSPVPAPTPQQVRSAADALPAAPVTPEVRQQQIDAWLKYGGLDLIIRLFRDDEDQLDAVARSVDPAKIGPVCVKFSQAPHLASAYFPVPDPVLQKRWSLLTTYIGQAGADCLHGIQQKNTNLFITAVIKLIKIDTQANPVVGMIVAEGKPPRSSSNHLPAPSSATTTAPVPSPPLSPADPLAGASPGDCYANNGTEDDPQWHGSQLDSGCVSGEFKVAGVEPDTTDSSSACSGVADWDLAYSYPAGDQVLCMAYQDSSPAYGADVSQCVFGVAGSAWEFTSCGTGSFTVVNVYRNSTSPDQCGSDSDEHVSLTVPGYPDLDKMLCLQMNFPWISTVQVNGCVWESGSGSDTSFSPVTACSDANEVVEGRIIEPDDGSFCGQYAWYTWQSSDYPDLGVTVCLGSPD